MWALPGRVTIAVVARRFGAEGVRWRITLHGSVMRKDRKFSAGQRTWRRALLVVAILAAASVVLPLVLRTVLHGPDRRATADALDQASRIARAGYVLAGSYSGDETPSNAEVADEIATGTGVHAVLARSVRNPDRHGVGTLAPSTSS